MDRPLEWEGFQLIRPSGEATIFVSDTYNTLAGAFAGIEGTEPSSRGRSRGRVQGMKRMLPYLLLTLLVFGGLVSVAVMNPVETRAFLLTADVFGWSAEARQEAQRIARISAMTDLEDWQREALKHRQVFKQANVDMTKLALGIPTDELRVPNTNGTEPLALLIYLFDDSARYTGLWYDRGHLFASQQMAAPDVEHWRQQAVQVAPRPAIMPIASQAIR